MKVYLALITLLIVAIVGVAQCSPRSAQENSALKEQSDLPRLTVTAPYAYAAAAGGNSAVYLKLMNESNGPDTLLSVESQVAEAAELHETWIDENEMARMRPLAHLEVPAGSSVSLEPGGRHIMLIRLKQELKPGDKIPLALHFTRSGSITVEAEIREAGAAMEVHPEH